MWKKKKIGSPKASPRNSPFTSPRGSNQWSSRPSVGDVSVSRRGSRFDGVEIRETPNEEEAETEKSSANTGPSQGGPGTKERSKQQHLTIPKKGMELSSSAETLSGKWPNKNIRYSNHQEIIKNVIYVII